MSIDRDRLSNIIEDTEGHTPAQWWWESNAAKNELELSSRGERVLIQGDARLAQINRCLIANAPVLRAAVIELLAEVERLETEIAGLKSPPPTFCDDKTAEKIAADRAFRDAVMLALLGAFAGKQEIIPVKPIDDIMDWRAADDKKRGWT